MLQSHAQRNRQAWPPGAYRLAWLLAASIAIPFEWLGIFATAHYAASLGEFGLWIIVPATWLCAAPIAWVALVGVLGRRIGR